MPTSSPQMTRMFGRCPDGAGCCACAWAVRTDAAAPSADAAASVVPPSRMLRRLSAASFDPIADFVLSLSFPVVMSPSFSDHTSEADVARRRIDRLGMARGRPVAAAIVGRAQVRAALEHLARNPDVGLAGVEACVFGPAARI